MFLYLKRMVLSVIWGAVLFANVQAESLTRHRAVQIALEKNLEVAAAQSRWDAERARSLQAWALPDPELEMEWEGMKSAFGFGSFGERQVGMSQRLELPFKWWMRGQLAKKQALATQLGVYDAARQDIALRVHVAYDRVLADTQIVTFAKENVGLAEQLVQRAKKRFAAGDVPQLDVMQVEVALGLQENRLIAAQNQLAISQAELNMLLNQPLDVAVVLTDSLVFKAIDDTRLDVLQEQSVMLRPEYLGASHLYSRAQKERSLAALSLVPDVSLGVFRQTVDAPAGRQQFWRTGIALELPVWSLFRQRGEIAEAGAGVAQARAERDLVKQRVAQEVYVAYVNVQATSKRALWMQNGILPTAKLAYEIARKSYDAGKASYLDLIEAQRGWVETQTAYVETLFEYRAAKAQLMRATGQGLLSEETIK